MDDIYVNFEPDKSVHSKPSTHQTGPRSSERRFHGAVVLCLGLLTVFLLAGLIGVGVHYYDSVQSSAAGLAAITGNLTKCLQNNKFLSLTKEKELLDPSRTETSKKLHCLKRCCPADWVVFSSSCYLLSNGSASWKKAKKDCRDRGAHLVVINSAKEQEFLSNIATEETHAWIGLTDRDQEGTWTWIDGAPVSLNISYWLNLQPDNGGGSLKLGEEDCAHIITGMNNLQNWNDLSCATTLRWICKKGI